MVRFAANSDVKHELERLPELLRPLVATNSTNQDSSPSSSQLLGTEQETHGVKTNRLANRKTGRAGWGGLAFLLSRLLN